LEAIALSNKHGIPLWDAQIVAAAITKRVKRILSEDFVHGTSLEGIVFHNPFVQELTEAEIRGE
jgi:predicted nucleic acid-binding protein